MKANHFCDLYHDGWTQALEVTAETLCAAVEIRAERYSELYWLITVRFLGRTFWTRGGRRDYPIDAAQKAAKIFLDDLRATLGLPAREFADLEVRFD